MYRGAKRPCGARPKAAPYAFGVESDDSAPGRGFRAGFADFGSAVANPAENSMNVPADPNLGAHEIWQAIVVL